MTNFDESIVRRGTGSYKWDFVEAEFDTPEEKAAAAKAIPMWIADMDFKAPEPVREALMKIAEYGVYGYTGKKESFYLALKNWLEKRHGWCVKRESMFASPGVLPGIVACVRAFTEPGDKIMIQTPVYYPFRDIIDEMGRKLVKNKLLKNGTDYTMDFEEMEKLASEPEVKMLFLSSPHNPVGRVWTEDELRKLGEICQKHNVMIIADEIHSDLIIGNQKHIPIGKILDGVYERYIAFYAPSKTFNLAGLQASGVVIPDRGIFQAFIKEMGKTKVTGNIFGIKAFEVAYTEGEQWLEELLMYLRGNYEYISRFIKKELPAVQIAPLEGTYLVWFDFTNTGLKKEEVNDFLLKEAGLFLDFGDWFDEDYAGFGRMNIACPRESVERAMCNLKEAFSNRKL